MSVPQTASICAPMAPNPARRSTRAAAIHWGDCVGMARPTGLLSVVRPRLSWQNYGRTTLGRTENSTYSCCSSADLQTASWDFVLATSDAPFRSVHLRRHRLLPIVTLHVDIPYRACRNAR